MEPGQRSTTNDKILRTSAKCLIRIEEVAFSPTSRNCRSIIATLRLGKKERGTEGGKYAIPNSSPDRAGRIWSRPSSLVTACRPATRLHCYASLLLACASTTNAATLVQILIIKERGTAGGKYAIPNSSSRSGWADLNRRPQVPQTCTLNPCATARVRCVVTLART